VIQHIVLLKLKPGTSDQQIAAAFEAGRDLPNEIPGVLQRTYGRDESKASHGFNIASVVQLNDERALETYLSHPKRAEYLERHVNPITEERIELDVPSEGTHLPTRASWFWGIAEGLE